LRCTQEVGHAHDVIVGTGEGWIQLQCPQQHGNSLCLLFSGTTGCHLQRCDQNCRILSAISIRGAYSSSGCHQNWRFQACAELEARVQKKSRHYLSIYPKFPPMLCIVRFIPNSPLVNIQGSDDSVQNQNPDTMILKTEYRAPADFN
jgi:hypothetical protein